MASDVPDILAEIERAATGVIDNIVDLFVGPAEILRQASPAQPLALPRDHYAHEDMQTEWWYYTGHLRSGEREFGFQLVFFKRRTAKDRIGQLIPMRVISPVTYYAHFAITDVNAKQFRYSHRRAWTDQGLAGATTDHYHVWLENWSARELNGQHLLAARMNNTELALVLDPVKPVVKQGQAGLSYKDEGEASYYLSYPRMRATGELIIGGERYVVTGNAWMDHEFGSWTMKEKFQGWDWFAVQLDDDQEVMAFQIRGKDGKPTRFSAATVIDREGKTRRFAHDEFRLTPLGEWLSPVTQTLYPSGWRLEIPSLGADFQITPLLRGQELDTRGSTMVIYWEGANTVVGRLEGRDVQGRAYVELVGYDRSHEALSLLDYLWGELQYYPLEVERNPT
jgi:predicted secreted hydrolase